MQHITANELKKWLSDSSREAPVLIDVREPWEFEICHIAPSELIPLKTLPTRYTEFKKEAPHVVICHHGNRSQQATLFLMNKGFSQVYNLSGGVEAWAQDVDPSMATY